MNALRFVLVGAAVTLAAASSGFAQRIEIELQAQPRFGLQADTPLLTPEAVEKIKFTADQQEKYRKIETEYKEKTKSANDKFRADMQGVRDREKFKEAREKLDTDSKKAREDSLAKVEPILTDDQKAVFARVKQQQPQPAVGGIRAIPFGGAGIGQVLPAGIQQRLQLTDDQKKQVEAMQKEVEAKLMKILTDEQKKQLEQMKKGINVRPIRPVQPNPRIQQIQPEPDAVPDAPARKKD